MNIKEFKDRFNKIEEEVDETDVNELEEKVYKLEEEINEVVGFGIPSEENALRNLLTKIVQLKKENDFYDADSELNRMFPNRDDEDSMTYDSVFGKE